MCLLSILTHKYVLPYSSNHSKNLLRYLKFRTNIRTINQVIWVHPITNDQQVLKLFIVKFGFEEFFYFKFECNFDIFICMEVLQDIYSHYFYNQTTIIIFFYDFNFYLEDFVLEALTPWCFVCDSNSRLTPVN